MTDTTTTKLGAADLGADLTTDLVNQLGELALATRLKRLGERLQRDVSRIYSELDMDFEARWFILLYALGERSPQPVTELARDAGLSHQAVGQIARTMIGNGLVRETSDRRDERKRLLQLTAAGRRLIDRLRPIWAEIRAANAALLAEVGADLLTDLARIEEALAARSMAERVRARIDLPPVPRLRIVDYRPAYKKHFEALNRQWLEEIFSVEEHDAKLLADPNGKIIKKGGVVLFARRDGEVVGTVALLKHPSPVAGEASVGASTDGLISASISASTDASNGASAVWELAKMAVAPGQQGRGIGQALADAAILRTRAQGARYLYLQTSPQLAAACRLYRRLGFRQVKRHPLPFADYCRCTLVMRLDLDKYESPAPREETR